jgi:hypothetical protein
MSRDRSIQIENTSIVLVRMQKIQFQKTKISICIKEFPTYIIYSLCVALIAYQDKEIDII